MLLQECLDLGELNEILEYEQFSSEVKRIYGFLYRTEESLMDTGEHVGFYKKSGTLVQVGPASIDDLMGEAKELGVTLDIIYAFDHGELFIPDYDAFSH